MSQLPETVARVDLRGFNYPLSPFVRKQEWRMESLLVELAKAQQAVTEAQKKYAELIALLQAQSVHIRQGQLLRPDPLIHRHGLNFLAQLQQQISDQQHLIETVKKAHARLQSDCIAQQRKLDGLAKHRVQAQQEYAEELTRREAAEADRDWIGRMHNRFAIKTTMVSEL